VYRNEILAVIGPAQSGKSSLLRCLNRTLDFTSGGRVQGVIRIDGEDSQKVKSVYDLRRKIGMVSPMPVGLPLSIYDNVAFAPRAGGHPLQVGARRPGRALPAPGRAVGRGEGSPRQPRHQALGRAAAASHDRRGRLSHEAEVLCLDEFSIAIDPVTTMRIEDVVKELRHEMTVILVTNLVHQARAARRTAPCSCGTARSSRSTATT
jgi:phosphate transport system ATP-binding protein